MIYVFHALRPFLPLYSFLVPFLHKDKKIPLHDLHGPVIRLFFISSLFYAFIGPVFISLTGSSKFLLVIESLCELIFYLSLLLLPKRKLSLVKFLILLHSASASFSMVTKDLLYSNENTTDKVYANYNLIKRTSSIFSAWLGQDLLFYSNNYLPLIIISIFSCFCTLSISFLVHDVEINRNKKNIFLIFKEIAMELYQSETNKLNYTYCFFIVSYMIASLIYISFIFYSSNIFIERRKDINEFTLRFSAVLEKILSPMRLISYSIILLLQNFIKIKKNKNTNVLLHGYMDGIGKLLSIIPSFFISSIELNGKNKTILSLILSLFSILTTFFMGHVRSLIFLYFIYICNVTITNLLLVITVNGFKTINNFGIFFGIMIMFCNLLHFSVSLIFRLKKKCSYHKNKCPQHSHYSNEKKHNSSNKRSNIESITNYSSNESKYIEVNHSILQNENENQDIKFEDRKIKNNDHNYSKNKSMKHEDIERQTKENNSDHVCGQYKCQKRMYGYLFLCGILYCLCIILVINGRKELF